MALPVNGSTHLIPALLLIYRPRKEERLSWPSWLTCSVRFTHISGHPSAAGRAQDRESSPVRDRRSTTVLCHQPHRGSPKIAPSSGGIWASHNMWFLRPTWVHIPNGVSVCLAMFCTARNYVQQTHSLRPWNSGNSRLHLCTLCMQYSLTQTMIIKVLDQMKHCLSSGFIKTVDEQYYLGQYNWHCDIAILWYICIFR